MSDEKKVEKKGVLTFEEGLKPFIRYCKGIAHFEELAIDIYLGGGDIGCITSEGKIIICGTVTEKDPSRIMSYANTFTSEQWDEIGVKKNEFKEKCAKREAEFGPAFKKLEDLASRMFSEDASFGHSEIAKVGTDHIVLAGGKGEWDTYVPGIYIYDDSPYGGEAVKLGYRPVEEQRIKGVNNLGDDTLLELVKAASSIGTFEG